MGKKAGQERCLRCQSCSMSRPDLWLMHLTLGRRKTTLRSPRPVRNLARLRIKRRPETCRANHATTWWEWITMRPTTWLDVVGRDIYCTCKSAGLCVSVGAETALSGSSVLRLRWYVRVQRRQFIERIDILCSLFFSTRMPQTMKPFQGLSEILEFTNPPHNFQKH
jgi:hypothetical protein